LKERARKEQERRERRERERQQDHSDDGGSSDGGDSSGDGDSSDDGGSSGASPMIYPVQGPITSPYGRRFHPILHVWKLHDGTDFGVGCGTAIHAAASGRVISRYYNEGYGNRLLVSDGQMRGVSVVTAYNHMSGYAVSTGEYVSQGEVVGYVGETGYATGCHLHFMVYENGSTVDPMGWL
ncbi:MAG: M23 family metallopeptidase, partial [Streptosporangiaceae bacterium]